MGHAFRALIGGIIIHDNLSFITHQRDLGSRPSSGFEFLIGILHDFLHQGKLDPIAPVTNQIAIHIHRSRKPHRQPAIPRVQGLHIFIHMYIFDKRPSGFIVSGCRKRLFGRELLSLQGFKPGGIGIFFRIEGCGIDGIAFGIFGIDGHHIPNRVHQYGQIVDAIGRHILIHGLSNSIIFLGVPMIAFPHDPIETKGLGVSIAFKQIAVDFIRNSRCHGLHPQPGSRFHFTGGRGA